jgi:hypothetical protein
VISAGGVDLTQWGAEFALDRLASQNFNDGSFSFNFPGSPPSAAEDLVDLENGEEDDQKTQSVADVAGLLRGHDAAQNGAR